LKVHLNAPITTGRLSAAGVVSQTDPCWFCHNGEDKIAHILQCNHVMVAYDAVRQRTGLPPIQDGRHILLLQAEIDGSVFAAVVAFFDAVWQARATCMRGVVISNLGDLAQLALSAIECPWLVQCVRTESKAERRRGRLREPPPVPDAVIYRSDGANRGQGRGESRAGYGAAVWNPSTGGVPSGAPVAHCRDYLGDDVSNNMAEYSGLRACLRRAVRLADASMPVVFDVDSKLVAMQMARFHPWACRAEDLQTLHGECVGFGRALDEAGVRWTVRHIYREFNQSADALANAAIDDRAGNGPSTWW